MTPARPLTGCAGPRARSRSARSGTSTRSLARAASNKLDSRSRRCSPTRTMSGCSPKRSVRRASSLGLPPSVHAPLIDQCGDESGLPARPRARVGGSGSGCAPWYSELSSQGVLSVFRPRGSARQWVLPTTWLRGEFEPRPESRTSETARSGPLQGDPRWALRDSNPRPSPCKGDRNVQVRGLTSRNGVTLEYLSSPWECFCLVVQEWCSGIKVTAFQAGWATRSYPPQAHRPAAITTGTRCPARWRSSSAGRAPPRLFATELADEHSEHIHIPQP